MVVENASPSRQEVRTHVFTLRLWQEPVNGGQWEWRGRLQQVLDGEVRYFRDWQTLIELLQAMLPDSSGEDI